MKRKRYTEEQIISILNEHEAGASVSDLARRHGVAENTVYRWKSRFASLANARSTIDDWRDHYNHQSCHFDEYQE